MTINEMPDYIFDTEFLTDEEVQAVIDEITEAPFYFESEGVGASNDGRVGIHGSNYLNRIIMMSGSNDPNAYDQLRPMARKLVEKFCDKHQLKLLDIYRTRTNITFKSFDRRPTLAHVDLHGSRKHYVLLFYTNDADGDTIMFTQKSDGKIYTQEDMHISKRFTPKKGAALLFDGDYFHTWEHPIYAEYRLIVVTNISIELP
jgi:hypothetical protein